MDLYYIIRINFYENIIYYEKIRRLFLCHMRQIKRIFLLMVPILLKHFFKSISHNRKCISILTKIELYLFVLPKWFTCVHAFLWFTYLFNFFQCVCFISQNMRKLNMKKSIICKITPAEWYCILNQYSSEHKMSGRK